MNDTVTIDANRWHEICHELEFDSVDRKTQFEECFDCTVTWRSRVQEWDDDRMYRPNPVMMLQFHKPTDSIIFALRWL